MADCLMWPVTVATILCVGASFSSLASPGGPPSPAFATEAGRWQVWRELELDGPATEQAERYLKAADAVRSGGYNDRLCDLVGDAQALAADLGKRLSKSHEGRVLGALDDRSLVDVTRRFEAAVRQAGQLLPGIGLASGAENLYSFVRYDELADLLPEQSTSAQLLRAVAGIWHEPNGWPVFLEQTTDVTGCWRPGNLAPVLNRIQASWQVAPACLQARLAPSIGTAMQEAVDTTCFCDASDAVIRQLDEIASVYEALPVAGASTAAAAARAARIRPENRFNCR